MTARTDNWLAVDRQGLRQVLAQKGKARTLLEIPANALDTSATVISILFEHRRGDMATLVVTDDDPNGFSSLVDSYTLYAPSTRKADAEKRGRFGLGDKEVLALCDEAKIVSTSGTVIFDAKGRRQLKTSREFGSEIRATLAMTKAEAKEFETLVRTIIIPDGVAVTFNGDPLTADVPLRSFEATLPTVLADAEGNLRPTSRKTTVTLYEPAAGEKPTIFELGMPVVEADGAWHVNVGQKVPLNSDRDNVTPAYLRKLREALLNNTTDLLDPDAANSAWVKDAFQGASPEAQREVIRERFGDKVVAFDPSDQEANKRAIDQGYTVVGGRSLSKDEWAVAKSMDLIPAAGKVLPSGVQRNGVDNSIPEAKWTAGQQKVVAYARRMAEYLGVPLRKVEIEKGAFGQRHAATWSSGGTLTFNLTVLSHKWFTNPDQQAVDALLIHEFAHASAMDHFSDGFYNACCRLGAALRTFQETI